MDTNHAREWPPTEAARTNPTDNRLALTSAEARSLLGVGRRKLNEMLLTGEIPGFRIGRHWRVPVDGLLAWMDQNTKGGRR